MAHTCRGAADEPVAKHEQRGQDKYNAHHADDSSARHKRAHGADYVYIRIYRHAVCCGEKPESGNKYRGYGGGKRRRNAFTLGVPRDPFGFVARCHKYRVVDGCAELYSADADRSDKRKRLP